MVVTEAIDLTDNDLSLDETNVTSRIKKLSKEKHEIYIYRFSGRTPEDMLIFAADVHKVIRGKPCLTSASRFNVIDSLVEGEALLAWKDIVDKVINILITTKDKDPQGNNIIKKRGKSKRAFKECMKKFMRAYFPERAVEKQKTYLRNNLKKSLKRSCRETIRRLKESNDQLTD